MHSDSPSKLIFFDHRATQSSSRHYKAAPQIPVSDLPLVSTVNEPLVTFVPTCVLIAFPDSSLPLFRIWVTTSTSFDVPNTFSSCCFDGRPSRPCDP